MVVGTNGARPVLHITAMSVTYSVGERVLCYHGPLIYEAKVLKYETWDETNTLLGTLGTHCFVHYKGWKQTSVNPPNDTCSS